MRPLGGAFGVILEVLERSWSFLGPHVGPMLAPCWRPLGILGHLGAFLERSGAYLEPIFDQHRTEDERQRLDSRKTFKNHLFLLVF